VWQTPPVSRRVWETEITEALLGQETRQALRAVARRQIIFTVTATTPSGRSRLDARVDAALKSGLGCAPLHGRACFLGANLAAGANSLTLAAGGAWNWQAGDYVALLQDDMTFDVLPVTGVAGLVLSLAATAPAYNWTLGALAWPVIFGAFTADKEAAVSGMLAQWKVTVTELVSGRSAQIGVSPAHVPGVGEQVIGSTNVIG
jgi:hypothetical protein